jgi:hypothetical protein
VYGREIQGRTLNFEASGGLIHASLIMQDRETDSYWSIMTGEAIAGKMKGAKLTTLPIGEKVSWKEWVKKHPDTLVLSVNKGEDLFNVYKDYFDSPDGFWGIKAADTRLITKEPVFAFHFRGQGYAVPHKSIKGGKAFDVDGVELFFYRLPDAELFQSTLVFKSNGPEFKQKKSTWYLADTACTFDTSRLSFQAKEGPCAEPFPGFDTFWYNWSLSNPNTKILSD